MTRENAIRKSENEPEIDYDKFIKISEQLQTENNLLNMQVQNLQMIQEDNEITKRVAESR